MIVPAPSGTAPGPQPLPAVFAGHGSPMNAIEDNPFHRGWRDLAARLPRSKAILCISAHWDRQGIAVTTAAAPETLHDFRGFPQALFDVRYPAPGSRDLAGRVLALMRGAGESAEADPARGLDHGAWGVLLPMYPNADIPVVQLSINTREPASRAYRLGQILGPLRDEGVLVLGSGNIVHNLRTFDYGATAAAAWAERFNDAVKQRIALDRRDELIDYQSLGHDAAMAVPTAEHYLPLLYVLALQRAGEPVAFFNDQVVSSISMTGVLIGG